MYDSRGIDADLLVLQAVREGGSHTQCSKELWTPSRPEQTELESHGGRRARADNTTIS